MKKVLLIVVCVVVVAVAAVLIFMPKGPNLKQFEQLKNPVITEKPNQNMLVVEAIGDPAVQSGKAIKLLYKTFFLIKGVSKNFAAMTPRARWPIGEGAPKEQWLGLFALPIPDSIKTLPVVPNPDSLRISIYPWDYGSVAEILHVGSYDTEKPTVQRLKDYIKQQGYTIIGEHEEEYLKGPSMFGKGNPDKYLTIIRYKVMKKSDLLNSGSMK
jgi:hypothetical protein